MERWMERWRDVTRPHSSPFLLSLPLLFLISQSDIALYITRIALSPWESLSSTTAQPFSTIGAFLSQPSPFIHRPSPVPISIYL